MDSEKSFLDSYDITNYDRPSITVDIAAFTITSESNAKSYRHDSESTFQILLTHRNQHPFKNDYALPGGFLGKNEDIKACAMKNIVDKTHVKPVSIMPLGSYGTANRDPRGWIVSNAFISVLNNIPDNISDTAVLFDIAYKIDNKHIDITLASDNQMLIIKGNYVRTEFGLDIYEASTHTLAFDHDQILIDAIIKLLSIAENMNVMLDFMPEEFTLTSLQQVTEAITNKITSPANFRRKIAAFVTETDDYQSGAGHRPAKLFKRK